MTYEDPGIGWIRRVRHEISEECGHDPHRLVEYYRRLEEREGRRSTREQKPRPERKAA
jgi:hypothetical protein